LASYGTKEGPEKGIRIWPLQAPGLKRKRKKRGGNTATTPLQEDKKRKKAAKKRKNTSEKGPILCMRKQGVMGRPTESGKRHERTWRRRTAEKPEFTI